MLAGSTVAREGASMGEPFIFIGTHRLQPGKLAAFREAFSRLVEVVEDNEPRMIAFNGYANEYGSEVSVVQVHPDAASMAFHMSVVREHITSAYEDLLEETTSIQVFGTLDETTRGMMQQLAGAGVPIVVEPEPIAGFTRSSNA
jgi:hypothetical protein